MKRKLQALLLAAGLSGALWAAAASVVDSPHNLSPTGPGQIRAAESAGVCEFCHIPHNAAPDLPLWSRDTSGTNYQPYSSSTVLAAPGQPNGTSLLCLSCHDGTVALGDVLSRVTPIAMAGGVTTMPAGDSLIGTDLSHDHPVSFVYDTVLASQRGELSDPAVLPPHLSLDVSGQMQCTTCHDPHDNAFGDFLVMANTRSALCVECHTETGWLISPHSQSTASWDGTGLDPWPESPAATVADNACRNCHEAHEAVGGPRLLRFADEEMNCSACHDGSVAAEDIMSLFARISAHPIGASTGLHDPAEPALVDVRHVECADCHDAHGGDVGGVALGGAAVQPAMQSYEVCLRCHGDSPGKGAPLVLRQLDQNNVRLEIQLANPSYHPIAGPGRNPDVPSLIAPLTPQSTIECIDCHNSNTAASPGGAEGPHGSDFRPLLKMQYVTTDNTSESAANYALCYSCHSRSSILNDQSFGEHRKHIVEENSQCSACHDPHGISATQGNSTNNTHLINFDINVVQPNSEGNLRFMDEGRFTGSCDLACHGEDHRGESY